MIGFVMPESRKLQYYCLHATKRIWSIWPQSFESSINDLHERCNWNRIKDELVEFWSILTLVAAPPVLASTETQSVSHTSGVPVTKAQIHTSVQPPALQEQALFMDTCTLTRLILLTHGASDRPADLTVWLCWIRSAGESFVTEGRVALLDRPVCFYSSPDSEVTFWFSCSLSEKSIQELR